MNTSLLDGLTTEISNFTKSGKDSLSELLSDSQEFLNELKSIESSLEVQSEQEESNKADPFMNLEKLSNDWYKQSISHLKTYNTATNRFSKNILNNSKYNIDLDEAYTYPLNLNNFPIKLSSKIFNLESIVEMDLKAVKLENYEELLKAIILHLLKIGQCDLVKDLVNELQHNIAIDETLLSKFKLLNEIFDDIVVRHDLSKALQWFKYKYNEGVDNASGISQISNPTTSNYDEIEFKFHMLQFTLLLNKNSAFNLDNALEAYLYSKDNFPKFFKDYLHEISPLMSLLLFKTSTEDDDYTRKHMVNMLSEFSNKMKHTFNLEKDKKKGKQGETDFVGEILANFENIHNCQSIFVNLSNEFISEYCKDLRLSNDSSLFQSILAGFINLPSFYKYNKVQIKLNKVKEIEPHSNPEPSADKDNPILEVSYNYDLTFQLPDSNRFLFKYHPIFICPISKEQLIPVTSNDESQMDEEHKKKKKKRSSLDPNSNISHSPVVVMNFCQHVALKDSVWQLSKKGTEIFKCHYCYKKHKFSDVSDAYFIDL